MVLAMIFWRLIVEMVIVDLEDLDFAETGAIGWILSVLAIVVAKIGNNWFIALIASLNIVAKMFAKIEKRLLDCRRGLLQ